MWLMHHQAKLLLTLSPMTEMLTASSLGCYVCTAIKDALKAKLYSDITLLCPGTMTLEEGPT